MLRQFGRTGWVLAFPLFVTPPAASADDGIVTVAMTPVTVLATRTERSDSDVARSVDVVDARSIARQQSNDLGAAIGALPNVSLSGSPRPSGEQLRIRGLSGEHVLTLVDGVRQSFSKGHLSSAFIDPDLVKQIDVQRGPASVLWGSGALGGVVSVQTKDASDLLEPGQSVGARLKGGYRSASNGWLGSAAVYGNWQGRVEGLVHVGRRHNGDLRLGGGERLDHSAYREDSLLAKATAFPTDGQFVQLSHRSVRLSGTTPSDPADRVSRENPLLSRDIARDTTQVNWRWTPASQWVDLNTQLFHTDTRVDESALTMARKDHTRVDTIGLDAANSSRFDLGALGRHTFTYGADAYRDRTRATRNGAPRPEFPHAERRLVGTFVQDEIGWGRWTASLGLRYDRYHSESAAGVAPAQDKSKLSRQAGLLWQGTDWLSLYANYAEAFRAPSLEELYATGVHFGANRFLPNPGLKPERAANKELGLRMAWNGLLGADDHLAVDVSAFRNDVRDFIDTVVTVTTLPGPPYVGGTTRSENVTNARLQGLEANALYVRDAWFVGLGYGRTRGHDESSDQPLADVAPDRWVLRIGYTQLPWKGRITLRATVAASQHRVPPGTEPTAGYAGYDLFTSWHPRDDLRLDVGMGNITDKAYRRHNAVINEAGRNVMASVTWHY